MPRATPAARGHPRAGSRRPWDVISMSSGSSGLADQFEFDYFVAAVAAAVAEGEAAAAAQQRLLVLEDEFGLAVDHDIRSIGAQVDDDILAVTPFDAGVEARGARIFDDNVVTGIAPERGRRQILVDDDFAAAMAQPQPGPERFRRLRRGGLQRQFGGILPGDLEYAYVLNIAIAGRHLHRARRLAQVCSQCVDGRLGGEDLTRLG